MYIYILSYRVTHTYIYIYFKPHNPSTQPSQQQQPTAAAAAVAAAAAAAAAGCCYTFEEMEEMQASANVPIRDIYIYQVYHLNGICKIGGKYSHHLFELYTRFIIFSLVVKYIQHIFEIYTRFIICSKYMCNRNWW